MKKIIGLAIVILLFVGLTLWINSFDKSPILPERSISNYEILNNRLGVIEKRLDDIQDNQDEVKKHLQIASAIISCESSFRPHVQNSNTSVGTDVGYFQINTHFHLEESMKMGLDIYSPEDNLKYGYWLLSEQGTKPWNASKNCWAPKLQKANIDYKWKRETKKT